VEQTTKNWTGSWSLDGATKIGEDGATLCHTIFQLLLLPWSQLIFFCPAVGNKRKTLTVCYPHLFGGLQFSFASFCPLFLFFIYFFWLTAGVFYPPSEHLLKLPE